MPLQFHPKALILKATSPTLLLQQPKNTAKPLENQIPTTTKHGGQKTVFYLASIYGRQTEKEHPTTMTLKMMMMKPPTQQLLTHLGVEK